MQCGNTDAKFMFDNEYFPIRNNKLLVNLDYNDSGLEYDHLMHKWFPFMKDNIINEIRYPDNMKKTPKGIEV
jgi:hypothetical protein